MPSVEGFTPEQVAEMVSVPLHGFLTDCHNEPGMSVDIVLNTLPFGRRALLEAVGVVDSNDEGRLALTKFGHHVITACFKDTAEWDAVVRALGYEGAAPEYIQSDRNTRSLFLE